MRCLRVGMAVTDARPWGLPVQCGDTTDQRVSGASILTSIAGKQLAASQVVGLVLELGRSRETAGWPRPSSAGHKPRHGRSSPTAPHARAQSAGTSQEGPLGRKS